ncbi:hypothetical protein LJC23_06315, partial [Desulfovibrio sp. OttesenSCG-928-I05]|nr:hypothetical protein [Desulfovibrio sp. OttesenSCG-928-I05]
LPVSIHYEIFSVQTFSLFIAYNKPFRCFPERKQRKGLLYSMWESHTVPGICRDMCGSPACTRPAE